MITGFRIELKNNLILLPMKEIFEEKIKIEKRTSWLIGFLFGMIATVGCYLVAYIIVMAIAI